MASYFLTYQEDSTAHHLAGHPNAATALWLSEAASLLKSHEQQSVTEVGRDL